MYSVLPPGLNVLPWAYEYPRAAHRGGAHCIFAGLINNNSEEEASVRKLYFLNYKNFKFIVPIAWEVIIDKKKSLSSLCFELKIV